MEMIVWFSYGMSHCAKRVFLVPCRYVTWYLWAGRRGNSGHFWDSYFSTVTTTLVVSPLGAADAILMPVRKWILDSHDRGYTYPST